MARTEEKCNTCKTVMRKHEGRRPLRGSRHRRCNNIKMALKEIGWAAWTGLIRVKILLFT